MSGLVTLGIFMFLPFAELISVRYSEELRLYRVEAVIAQPPVPPEAQARKPPQEPLKESKRLPKPKLEKIRRQLKPLQVALSLQLGMDTPMCGDFDLNIPLQVATRHQAQLEKGDIVFELSEVDRPPRPLFRIPPLYPMSAKIRGIEGVVELMFVVDVDGSVKDIEIKSSSPEGVFDKSAIRAVRQWRFKPASKGGKPVRVRVLLPVRFQLKE